MSDTETRCYFCGELGGIVCDSNECQTHDREHNEELDRIYAEDLKCATKAAIRNRCKGCDDYGELSRLQRWFYTTKCLTCVWLGWKMPGNLQYPSRITVAQHHYAKLYAGWESRAIVVGHGIFSQWWFDLESDGDWWM